jgi:hypothetical protein
VTTHPILLRVTRLPVGRRASGFVQVAKGGRDRPSALDGPGSRSGIRFDAEPIVHGTSELLFTSEVPLRGLDGDVAQEKLDLLEFATG